MFGLEKIAAEIEIPPHGVDADIAIPSFRENPQELAEKIRKVKNPLLKKVTVAGRYVNVVFDMEKLASAVIREVAAKKEKYGWNDNGAGKKVMIEYSSPNIAKPMHMGHARNNALGHALCNIYEANGYEVIAANYIGDWGMSFAKILVAYHKWGDEKELERDAIRHLLALYVRVTKEIEQNPDLEDEARVVFKQLVAGERTVGVLWKKFRDISLADFKRVYALLGISFDIWHGESFYEQFIENIVREALDKKVATQEPGGPVVVNLDRFKLPSFLLKKTDGASLYSARDLAVAKWRLKNYNPDKMIYVVGHDQKLYLQQIFKTLALMGHSEEKFEHVSYGVVTLNGKKIATRSGDVVFLEEGLKEAIARAKGVREVGVGAVVFNMLSAGREHDIAFSWDTALHLQGNSAPYIQYGYVRAVGILHKVPKAQLLMSHTPYSIKEKNEKNIVKMMAWYPEVVRQARELNAPHVMATFLNTLVREFNRFYATTPVITESGADANRVQLVSAVAQIIKNGLWLLGIGVPEKM